MLPKVQQVSAAIMGKLQDHENLQLLAILGSVRQGLAELPAEFPEPGARQTPDRLRQRRRERH